MTAARFLRISSLNCAPKPDLAREARKLAAAASALEAVAADEVWRSVGEVTEAWDVDANALLMATDLIGLMYHRTCDAARRCTAGK